MENTIEIEESKGKNKGFTLIELLIVIVILGILAAVTVFAVRGITDNGRTSACAADKKTLETAGEAYFANFGGTTIPAATAAEVLAQAALTPPVVIGATPEGKLVVAGLMHSESAKYDILANGGVTPQAGQPAPACT